MVWLHYLKQLTFRDVLNQSIEDVAWSDSSLGSYAGVLRSWRTTFRSCRTLSPLTPAAYLQMAHGLQAVGVRAVRAQFLGLPPEHLGR